MTKKKHLYEVDLMRCFFMFGVVLNHVASTFAAALGNKATPAGRFLVSTHLILHFPRFGFMFITGLVLFLGYWGRPEKQNWPFFWKKCYIGSGIPYLFWNDLFLAFLLLTSGSFSWNKWLTGHPVRGAETKSCFSQSPPVLFPAPAFGQPPRSP